MMVCQSCGTANQEDRSVCSVCGAPLDLPTEDSLAALRRLASLDRPESEVLEPAEGTQADLASEQPPDWLQLLMAKYEEAPPASVTRPGGARSPAPPAVAATRPGQQIAMPPQASEPPAFSDQPKAETVQPTEEIPDWLAELRPPQQESSTVSSEATEPGTQAAGSADASPSAFVPQPGEPLPLEEAPASATTPDWLDSLRQAVPSPIAEDVSVPAAPPSFGEPEPEAPVPDWVRALGELKSEQAQEQPPSAAASQPEAEDEEVLPFAAESEAPGAMPDWLAKLLTPSAQGPEETAAAGAAESQIVEVPSWMQEVDMPEAVSRPEPASSQVVGEPVTTAETSQPAEIETSDWLDLLRASEQAPREPIQAEALQPPPAGVETEPDWLAELRSAAVVAPAEASLASAPPAEARTGSPAAEESAELEWLRALEKEAGPASRPTPPPVAPGPKVPDWLGEASSQPAGAPEPQATATVPSEPEMPVWLQELSAAAAASAVPPAPSTVSAPSSDEEVPPWLRNLSAASPSQPRSAEGPVVASASAARGAIVSDEIPEWLRKLQPKPEPAPTLSVPGAAAGPAQLGEPDQATQPHLAAALQPDRPTGQEPEAPIATAQPRPRRLLHVLGWGLVFVILIIAILVMLRAVLTSVQNLMGGTAFQQYLETPAADGLMASVQAFREQIASLPDGAVVVVSFDYTPATAAEMEPLASAVMRDLLSNRARVLAVSLQLEGAAMADRLLSRLADDYPDGARVLNLGYLPGQTIGVRSLSRLTDLVLFEGRGKTLADDPSWRDVTGPADVALVVLLADAFPTARWWIEQIAGTPLAQRPLLAATSASAGPLVRPYRAADGSAAGPLREVISGLPAAAAYEASLEQPDRATRMLAAQSVAHLGLVVFGLASVFLGFRAQVLRPPED